MKRTLVIIFSLFLIVFGLVSSLMINVLVGFVLLFVSFKKYNLKKWLNGFALVYIIFAVVTLTLFYAKYKADVPYTLLNLLYGLILLGLNYLVPSKKIVAVSPQ